MAEPRPVRTLFLLEGLGLGALALWWSTRPPGVRYAQLLAVRDGEQVATLPPSALLDQAQWLIGHRWEALTSLAVLAGVALVIGVVEGAARRARDDLGGFRLSWWTAGILASGLVVGSTAAYLVVPWPVRMLWVAVGMSGLVGLMGYGLGLGRPYAK